MKATAPVEVGGIVRVRCDTTDNRRVDADIVAESVDKLHCGCWRVRCLRPGPDMGDYGCERMEFVFQVCTRIHEDGRSDDPPGTAHPLPIVIRRGPGRDPDDIECGQQDETGTCAECGKPTHLVPDHGTHLGSVRKGGQWAHAEHADGTPGHYA